MMKQMLDEEKNKVLPGMLYLVATPIGNLSDISERAIKVLSGVDFIAAEDTRNSRKLLTCLGIQKPLTSYFEHNKAEKGPEIIQRLQNGESCALITDAGTPAISDPGEDLVRLCAKEDVPVTSIPGCVASITALTLSALSTNRFVFEGFLPTEKSERKKRFEILKNEERTILFHEAPHKLKTTLKDLLDIFGEERRIAICRELTKINEEVLRLNLKQAVEYYQEKEPRGEYVLVLQGGNAKVDQAFWQNFSLEQHLDFYIKKGLPKKEAIKQVAKDRNIPKNDVYIVATKI